MPGPYSFFPSSGAGLIDDFNRPDGGLGANWTIMNSSPLQIVSAKCAPGGGSGRYTDRYNVRSYTDVEAYATVNIGTSGRVKIVVRDQGVDQNAPVGYSVFYEGGLFGLDAPAVSGGFVSLTVVTGDKIGIRVTGTASGAWLEGWLWHGGTWTQEITFFDNSAPPQFNSGYVCLLLQGPYLTNDNRFDDVYAGPFTAVAAGSLGRLPLLGAG